MEKIKIILFCFAMLVSFCVGCLFIIWASKKFNLGGMKYEIDKVKVKGRNNSVDLEIDTPKVSSEMPGKNHKLKSLKILNWRKRRKSK